VGARNRTNGKRTIAFTLRWALLPVFALGVLGFLVAVGRAEQISASAANGPLIAHTGTVHNHHTDKPGTSTGTTNTGDLHHP